MSESLSKRKKRIVIVGGGFGGIKTALELEKFDQFNVTLISDVDSFYYHANLYRTVTGANRAQTVIPLSDIFVGTNVRVIKDSITAIDRSSKQIIGVKKYPYDSLVLAIGAVTNYFHIKGLAEHSYGFKTYNEAIRLKNHLHNELINRDSNDLNYFIVGGGASGVELAGELTSYLKIIYKQHKIRKKTPNITLVEAKDRLMPQLDKKVSIDITKRLKKLGVKINLHTKVEGESINNIYIDGKPIKTHTVIWTAGIKNHPFFEKNDFNLSARGLVEVNEHLKAEPDIFVIGDNADTKYSGMAQTAVSDAVFVAYNIIKQSDEKSLDDYEPKRPVYVTPIGPRWASVVWGNTIINGRIGWLIRRVAEFAAYKEVETWWKASKSWFAGFSKRENCPICAVNNQGQD